MKRIITYISILAAALTAGVSCSQDLSLDEIQEGGKLTLIFRTEQMGTRLTVKDSDPVKGIGAENTIEHIDYFFFPNDNPTSEAVVYGRLTVDQLTKVSETEYKYDGFDTSKSEYASLKGPSYLYVLANYPEEVNVKTMQALLALPISTDFTKEQTSFVMDSYDSAEKSALLFVTPKATDSTNPREVEVKLARAAAKLVLKINVTKSYTDEEGNVWKPEADQMWVNFLYARKNTTVAARPVAFDNKANYFNTAQQTPTSTTAVDANHTSWLTAPIYTYPQSYETSDVTAPYFKVFCPWVCDKMGLTNFYYKIILPQLGSFQRNKVYTLTMDLSVIGGTEDWALVSENIYVADWWTPEAIEASFEGAMYLDVPVKHFDIYGVDDVYIPVRSSNDIEVIDVTGRKRNLYQTNASASDAYVTVTPSVTNVSKDGFTLTHVLDDQMALANGSRNPNYDCTPIEYSMKVKHTSGGLSRVIDVTVTQYPSIYAEADPSNGYAYVNSYTYGNTSSANQTGTARGGRWSSYQNGTTIGYMAYNNNGDELASMNQGTGLNSNYNQYVVNVSVLPQGYKVEGMTEDVVIGDPRGGELTHDYLGYDAGTNGGRVSDVKSKYKPASSITQNVIAPALRIASSWGATIYLNDFDRAEERCAAYQENGYPAGRWRLPTVAEIDFLIQLSTYEHIPALFTTDSQDIYQSNRDGSSITYAYTYYSSYWSNGPSVYAGKPYTDAGHTSPYELGGTETSLVAPESESTYTTGWLFPQTHTNYGYYWWGLNNGSYSNKGHEIPLVTANSEYFEPHVRCVYDEWYWSSQKYGNNGQPSSAAATQWIGYIF